MDDSGVRARAGALAPGGVIGDGRYRLLAAFGADSRANAQFWRARDGQLSRDVALTVILGDQSDVRIAGAARRTLDRATHAVRFHHDGIARVLDVLSLGQGIAPSEGILGIVVSEWTPGTDLVDLLADGPTPPGTAAALLEPLAQAVEQAHHYGLVLGVDHPQRLRLTPDGALRLAFSGPLPHAALRDDVRGLGALLYLMLTGRWPLPGGPEALPTAPTGPDGGLVPPRVLQPDLPVELSSLAMRCLESSAAGGIRTPAAILQVLDQMATADPETQLISKVGEGHGGSRADPDNAVWTTKKPVKDPRRQRRLAWSVGLLVLATVAIAVWIVTQVIGFFSDSDSAGTIGPKAIVDSSTAASTSNPPPTTTPSPPPKPVKPDTMTVFNVEGTPDYTEDTDLAVDGDPGTEWKTENYFQDFPALKPGEGLMARFGKPVKLAEVDIVTHDPGADVEIRTAGSANPGSIDDTRLISRKATLADGSTKIRLRQAEPSRYILVWITHLPGSGDHHRASLAEITYQPAR